VSSSAPSTSLSTAARRRCLTGGIVLASMAAAIALGATSMSDIALLSHLAPLLGAAPSGPTARRALDLAGTPRMLDRIARARARARDRAWTLIAAAATGFPWLAVAGKALDGWIVIDMDATLVTAHSDKEGAAPTWKKGYGFHPLGGLVPEYAGVPGHEAQARERRLEHLHRPRGSAVSRHEAGAVPVPAQGPRPRRRRRRQPRPGEAPAGPELEKEDGAVHDRGG
jgi:hypothetical protein